jgi:hypothetical protein
LDSVSLDLVTYLVGTLALVGAALALGFELADAAAARRERDEARSVISILQMTPEFEVLDPTRDPFVNISLETYATDPHVRDALLMWLSRRQRYDWGEREPPA